MLRIAICDDNELFQEILEEKVKDYLESIEIDYDILHLNSLVELGLVLKNNKIDLLFLDIMFNNNSSIDWALEQRLGNNVEVIFMTSFPEEAYNISRVEHSFFLVKSHISDELLKAALQNSIRKISKKDANLALIRSNFKNQVINFQDILYLECINNNTIIHFKSRKSISIYSTLTDFSSQLPPNFQRCHKSYTVNMNMVIGFRPHCYILSNGEAIPIPPKKFAAVIHIYKNYINAF